MSLKFANETLFSQLVLDKFGGTLRKKYGSENCNVLTQNPVHKTVTGWKDFYLFNCKWSFTRQWYYSKTQHTNNTQHTKLHKQ
jgi:hypothetical protein